MTKAVAFAAAVALAGPALAGETPVETATLGEAKITLHVHDFLLEDELMALRLVMTNEDALALFVPKSGGFAALAMSPDDGFIRDGAPAKSAVALADLPDAGTAAAEAAKACDGLRKGKSPCVVVLEIAPE
ncbi:MAG: hypothetical protein IPL38_16695 [Rhodobacter sp.]|jgi:hypothetical protein|nr:hypothetical protein [Rhodobacter sp.]MBK8441060.1 hypothetical protein [Rhodobacter sp.]